MYFKKNSIKSIARYVFLLAGISLFLTAPVFAQISEDLIGTDPGTEQRYVCLRYVTPELNTVMIVDSDTGKESFKTPAAAKRQVNRRINKLKENINQTKTKRTKIKERLRNIRARTPLTPKGKEAKEAQLARVQQTLDNVNNRLSRLTVRRQVLVSIREGVVDCKKSDNSGSSTLRVVSALFESAGFSKPTFGSWIYVTGGRMVVGKSYCYRVINAPGSVSGVSGGIFPGQVLKGFVRLEEQLGVAGFTVYGIVGREDPGTCNPEFKCSRMAADALLGGLLAGIELKFLGESSQLPPSVCR